MIQMLKLDMQTMLLITVFVLFLMASLMLLASLQLKRNACLLWTSIGLYLACVGIACSALRIMPIWQIQIIWFANVLLITVHACIWVATRTFAYKKINWWLFAAGGILWSFLCLFQYFLDEPSLRVLIFTLLCVAYFIAALLEILSDWRRNIQAVIPMVVIMIAYILVCFHRILFWHSQSQFWAYRPDSSLTIFALLLMSIGVSFSFIILVRAREENRYKDASLHDDLTGLYNRRALFNLGTEKLNLLSQHKRHAALLMLDLDWFKRINDKYGHKAGDKVLVDFANVLSSSIRANDISARIGGEEFVVLLVDVNLEQTNTLINRIRSNLDQRNRQADQKITVSIGVAMTNDLGYSLDNLLRFSDLALYKAKSDGRNCVRFISESLELEITQEDQLNKDHVMARQGFNL